MVRDSLSSLFYEYAGKLVVNCPPFDGKLSILVLGTLGDNGCSSTDYIATTTMLITIKHASHWIFYYDIRYYSILLLSLYMDVINIRTSQYNSITVVYYNLIIGCIINYRCQ